MNCECLDFNAFCDVNRIQKSDSDPEIIYYSVDLKIECRKCGQQFEFVGLPLGYSAYHPTTSIDGLQAHMPMVIPGNSVPDGLPGFGITYRPPEGGTQ